MSRTLEHVPQTWRRTVIEGRTRHLPEMLSTQKERQQSSAKIIEELNSQLEDPFWSENGKNGGNGKGEENETAIIWRAKTKEEEQI